MRDLIQHLNNAYNVLERIPVSGEAVELMALARQELRTAYKLAKEEEADG